MTNTYIAPGDADPEAMIAEVEKGFYAVSFGGGQVDPATGDFVFGVSEGYLIEGGKVTRPCRGATLIGNCLEALTAIDAVGDDFVMKTGICGKGGQKVPVGTGQGHVRVAGDDGRRDRAVTELSATAGRAVEAALAAGAGDAEAYASRDSGREVRVHGGEVESLTAATQRGIGVRAWIGGRVGYAYGTDLSEAGVAAIAAPRGRGGGGRRRGRVRRARPSPAAIEALPGLSDPSVAAWATGARWPSWRWRSSAPRSPPTRASPGSSRPSTPTPPSGSRSPPRPGSPASTSPPTASPTCRRWPRARAAARPASASASPAGPTALDPEAIGREGAERATAMIGAAKPASRSCPVVLDPTVAASFVGLIGGALGADAVQRGRSPFADRLGEELASEALVLHDDGLDPDGLGLGALRRRGGAAPAHRADRGRPPAHLPLRHLHRAPRGRRLDRQRRRARLPLAALGLGLEPGRRRRRALLRGAARRGRRRRLRHRRRRPALGRQPGHRRLLGRRLRAARSAAASWPSRCASSRSPATWSRCWARSQAAGAEARWVPFGGSVQHAAAADRRDGVSGS